jgi:hypothetical protein
MVFLPRDKPWRTVETTNGDHVMNTNVGSIDRVVRVVLGLALLSAFFLLAGPLRWLALAGLVLLLTAAFSFCPLYRVLGINTSPMASKRM